MLKKLKLLLLFNPLTEWLDTTHAMRLYIHDESVRAGTTNPPCTPSFVKLVTQHNFTAGKKEGTPASKQQIKSFIDAYGINMNDFEPSDVEKYDTFESFFTRRHRPDSRPIYEQDDPTKAVVVADSRVVVYESVSSLKTLWVKGRDFSIPQLVMDTKLGADFADGAVASFRLSPQDYHRYHSPVEGKIKVFRSIPGDYYQVDPVALHSGVDILTRNRREFVVIETKEFGDVLFVAIGATDVGSVQYVLNLSRFPPGLILTATLETMTSGKKPARRSIRGKNWESFSSAARPSLSSSKTVICSSIRI